MSEKEKLELLEEVLELEAGELSADQRIDELDAFDSMASLSLIVMYEDEFGKILTGEDIKKFVTVQDMLDAMN